MLGFLFVDDELFEPDAEAAAKNLNADALPALVAAVASLEPLEHWHADDIKEALEAVLDRRARAQAAQVAFAPLRVAVTGRTVSPPLFESMELLGRERSMARLRRAGRVGGTGPVGALPSALGRPCGVRYTRPAIGEACPIRWGMG